MTLSVPDGDRLFDLLVAAYDGMSDADRTAFLARLCLTLAHRIDDFDAVREAVREAQLVPITLP